MKLKEDPSAHFSVIGLNDGNPMLIRDPTIQRQGKSTRLGTLKRAGPQYLI